MIRKLVKKDHNQCLNFLMEKPAENLFIIADINTFGYDEKFQKIWGDFDENNKLRGVLLKYYGSYIPYAPKDFDAKGFAKIFCEDKSAESISGLKSLTSPVISHITKQLGETRTLSYAKCTAMNFNSDQIHDVKKATFNDLPKINDLYELTPEFTDKKAFNRLKHNLSLGLARTYYIEKGGRVVSSISTTAENSLSAMLVSLSTLKEYQGKGLATKCLIKICSDLLEEGKSICLFYDNPVAGKIYKNMGFEDIGTWTLTYVI